MKFFGKTTLIKEAILTDIRNGILKPDEKIPSRSNCMVRFSCARASIDRAVAELTAAGVLYSRQGSGTFVAPPPEKLSPIGCLYIIAAFGRHNEFSFHKSSIESALRTSLITSYALVDWSKISSKLDQIAKPGNAVLWKAPRYQELTAMEFLHNAGIPQILIGRDYEPYNFITTDTEFGIDQGLDMLCRAGGTRLGYIHSPLELHRHYIVERQLIFYSLIFKKDLTLPSRFTFCADRNAKKYTDSMTCAARQLLGGADPCRAIFMDYSLWYDDFIAAAAAMGKIPGRDFTLLIFDRPDAAELPAGVIAICQNYDRAAEQINLWLQERGRKTLKLRLKPVIEIGS